MLTNMGAGKSYVDMSTVDAETSTRIGQAITAKGGRFLEAPVSGSKKPAIDGQLILLCAGDEDLFTVSDFFSFPFHLREVTCSLGA